MQVADGRRSRTRAGSVLHEASLLALLIMPSMVTLGGVSAFRLLPGPAPSLEPAAVAGGLRHPADGPAASDALVRELVDSFRSRTFDYPLAASKPIWLHLPPDLFAHADLDGRSDSPSDAEPPAPDREVDGVTATGLNAPLLDQDGQAFSVGSIPAGSIGGNTGVTKATSLSRPRKLPRPAAEPPAMNPRPTQNPVRAARQTPASAPPVIELPSALKPDLGAPAPE